jgi:hypothetical protein
VRVGAKAAQPQAPQVEWPIRKLKLTGLVVYEIQRLVDLHITDSPPIDPMPNGNGVRDDLYFTVLSVGEVESLPSAV